MESKSNYGWKLRNFDIFIEMAREIHGDEYDYSETIFYGSTRKLSIICKEHGKFEQLARDHVKGRGCPVCRFIKSAKSKKLHHLNSKMEGVEQPEDYKLIPLDKGLVTKVDNEDFERVLQHGWYENRMYAYNTRIGSMHRFIMRAEKDQVVDHINHDTLDNRKANLRICTRADNSRNRKVREGIYSKFKGVTKGDVNGKFLAGIMFNYKRYHLGSFDTEVEAAEAYDRKAIELFGEFCNLNFPDKIAEYKKQIKENGE